MAEEKVDQPDPAIMYYMLMPMQALIWWFSHELYWHHTSSGKEADNVSA
jgi:hypothetical protein